MQFLQLVKLFKMRQAAKLTSDEPPEQASKHLMPPEILESLLHHRGKSKKVTEYLAGSAPLNLYCVTWNEHGSDQELRYDELFPDKECYDIIAFGSEECHAAGRYSQAESMLSYLGPEWRIGGRAGTGRVFLVAFVKLPHAS